MSYIDDLNQAASEALAASASATESSQIIFDVANGDENTTVTTANGEVKTLAKAIADITAELKGGTFDTVTEEITLSEGQTEVTLTSATTNGMQLYVEGVREFDFTVTSETSFTLSESLPDGTRIWVVGVEFGQDASASSVTDDSAGSTRTIGEWVAGIQYTHPTVAEADADTSLVVGSMVKTLGRLSVGDGGGNEYVAVPAGTGTDDGGSYIDLSASGLQLEALFPDGIRASQFGASESISVTDDASPNTTAIQNMLNLGSGDAFSGRQVLEIDGNYVIDGTLTTTGQNNELVFKGYLTPSDDFPQGDFLLDASGSNSEIFDPIMFCRNTASGNIASGIDVTGGGIKIHNPKIWNFRSYGIRLAGSFGDSNVYHPDIRELGVGDVGYDDDSSYIGSAIYFNRADCNVYGGRTYWSGVNIHFGPEAATCYVYDHHPFNGRAGSTDPSTARQNPVNILVEEGAGRCVFLDGYVDNGHVDVYSPSFSLGDCHFLWNTDAVENNGDPLIRVYAIGNTQPSQLSIDTMGLGDKGVTIPLIGFLDNDGNSFSGEYDVPMWNYSRYRSSNGVNEIFHRYDDDIPYKTIVKPGGTLIENHKVGDTSFSHEYKEFGGEIMTTDSLRIQDSSGTGEIKIGSTEIGVKASSGGLLQLFHSADPKVEINVTGAFRPVSDGTQNLGSGTNRWAQVFATTGTINTSDEREKTDFEDLSEAELAVARKVKALVGKYKWLSSIEEKGDDARWHFGVGAQSVKEAFESEGLDGFDYGCLCFDEWEDEDGVKHDRYGIRATELLFFVMTAL